MADKDKKKPAPAGTSATPGFDPKPMQLTGDSIVDRLLPHMKQIVIGVVVLAAVLTAIFTVKYFKERGREKETAKIARVLAVSQREVRPAGIEPDPTAKEPTFASNQERAQAVLDAIAKQGGIKNGGVFRASMLLQAGKIDEAITEYKQHTKGKSLDAVLAREGLGIALEAKAEDAKQDAAARQQGLQDALAAFESMQPDEKGPRYAYSLYHQGRILAILGKTAEARTKLEKAKELGAGSQLAELATERLAGLGA